MKTFELSDTQVEFIDKWYDCHMCTDIRDKSTIAYEFSTAGIGTRVVVRCVQCEAAIDVSEYDKW
jgi:hypothetical protein